VHVDVPKQIPESGRKAAIVISAHTLKIARPLFWHAGLRPGAEPKGASALFCNSRNVTSV
jgi:hypothetical protein